MLERLAELLSSASAIVFVWFLNWFKQISNAKVRCKPRPKMV